MMEYSQNDLLDYFTTTTATPVYKVAFQYASSNQENKAALNFHLTRREEKDIISSINSDINRQGFNKLLQLFSQGDIRESVPGIDRAVE